jgi:hypothetical protein
VSRSCVAAVIRASRDPGRFDHAEFRVIVNLADHLNDRTGQCNPGLRLLEEETGLGRGHLMRCINRLEERDELLRPESSKGGGGAASHGVVEMRASS